jgi:hypothetical protein
LADRREADTRRPRWPLFVAALLGLIILLWVGGRSAIDGVLGTVFKNAAEPLDKELPVTLTSFRSGANIVAALGGRGDGLNCSMPRGIDFIFTPKEGDPTTVIPVRQRFRQACAFHDMCYRHGLATYGYSQSDCDELLQEHALRICIWASKQKSLSECQLDAKKVTAGVKVMGYDAYRDWGESTYFEFDPNPYRSLRFFATRVIDHPLKASSADALSEPDQLLVRFEIRRGGLRFACLNCKDRSERAIGLPTGRQYSAPHLATDWEGRSIFVWFAREALENSYSCIVVANPFNLLTDTHPGGPGCYNGANDKLGLGQVDLLSSAPQLSLVPPPPLGFLPDIVSTGLTRQNGPLEICVSKDMRSGQKRESGTSKNGVCHKLIDPAGHEVLPGARWLGAFQNFPIVRGGRHIYLARTIATGSDAQRPETIRMVAFSLASEHVPVDPVARAEVTLEPGKSFDISDDFDPMLPLTAQPADDRLISARVVHDRWGEKLARARNRLALHEIDLAAPNPQPAELAVGTSTGANPILLHETWARRPILITEAGTDAEAKTQFILSRSTTERVATEKPKVPAGREKFDSVRFEFAVLERPVAPAQPPAAFRLVRALACTVTYTVMNPDDDRIHPCRRVTIDVSSDRATPATYLQGTQLLTGRFGSDAEPSLALVDACLRTRPIMVRPVGIGDPAGGSAEKVTGNLQRQVDCQPLGRAERLAEPL